MTENTKLQQAIFDYYSTGNTGLIEMMTMADKIENDLEIANLMIEQILLYISGLQKGEPSHYLAHSHDYWRIKAQRLQTERLRLERNLKERETE